MTHKNNLRYITLLIVQTLCAWVMLYHIHAVFRLLVENVGVQQPMPTGVLVQIVLAVVLGQICYWVRLGTVKVPDGRRSVLIGHVFAFASRISFVFGGALFSLYFLRHLPAMNLEALGFGLVWRGAALIAILFALYCYALELERLGNALQTTPKQRETPDNPG